MHWKLSVSCAEFKVAYFINHYLRFILAPQTWSPWTRCNRWLGAVKPFGKAPRLCGIGFIGGTSQGSSDVRSLKSRHVLFLLSCFLLHKTVPLKRWLSNYIWGFIKKPRPFNHIFGGDRILRAWYRGIKNAGPRKRAQGRAQDIPYHHISPYHHGIWRIFIECGKKTHARKSAQGRSARGPILPKSNRNFWQPPYTYQCAHVSQILSEVLQYKIITA